MYFARLGGIKIWLQSTAIALCQVILAGSLLQGFCCSARKCGLSRKFRSQLYNFSAVQRKSRSAFAFLQILSEEVVWRHKNKALLCMLVVLAVVSAFGLISCTSYKQVEEAVQEDFASQGRSHYANVDFRKYRFQSSKILGPRMLTKLGLENKEDVQYVLFAQFTRNFWQKSIVKERSYLIGRKQVVIEDKFQTQEEYYDLILVIEKKKLLSQHQLVLRQFSFQKMSIDLGKQHSMKDFFLSVQDFDSDGLGDLFFGFELYRHSGQYHYYLYSFQNQELTTLVRPWDSSQPDSGNGKSQSPFMRELNANIYPAFVAEIELDFNHTINIDLSPIADDLIRDKVYNKQGLVLRKLGIPHLDSNPILLPVRQNISNRYMLRSVQQIRNRYGQIGIFVCNWLLEDKQWIPDESSMEFLVKPRV